ncbi:methyltransferase domain-containing protein [Changchengzhania lutea]|uniref:hypothetical protein n=1 Tax=Changchengzhania lutea TaxID=2049305 RepID=UPI00115F5DEC|nr:hypothetical protein [Changchengzhania lutea]
MDLVEINSKHINRHPWELARQSIVNSLIKKHSSNKNLQIEVLDVGSGDAFLANDFTKIPQITRCHAVDIEYTDELKKQFNYYYQNKALKLYSSLNEVETETVNIVTLLDVIEHVPDDVAFINSITKRDYVNVDTVFIITVPAYQSLFSQHDVLLKHYRRYDLKLLRHNVNKSDLEVLDSGYFFFSLLIPRIVNLLIERFKTRHLNDLGNLGNWKGGKMSTSIIKSILLIDYQIGRFFKRLHIHIPGLSCYMICKKKISKS